MRQRGRGLGVWIAGDSHARGCLERVEAGLPAGGDVAVRAWVGPGAPLSEVIGRGGWEQHG